MGYAHHFRYNTALPAYQDAWPRMVADALTIVQAADRMQVTICGPHGDNAPKISDTGIALNGSRWQASDHDSLVICPSVTTQHARISMGAEPGFLSDTCKTGRRPYDVAVAAILLRCHLLAPEAFRINSDGRWDREWIYGAHRWEEDPAPPYGPSARALVAYLFGDAPTESPFTPAPRW
jgi:hypothetical protein